MKLRLLLLFPLLLTACSDLTPKEQEEPAPAPPPPEDFKKPAAKAPKPEPTPTPDLAPPADGPGNPLGFLDPDTTNELMTDAKKKTVTSANATVTPPPEVEDTAIDIDPPQLPEIKE